MEDALKHTFPVTLSLLLLTSCSWYRDLERSLVEDDEKQLRKSSARSSSVPREQYDELLVKYEELSKKYEAAKDGSQEKSLVEELQNTQTENFARTSPNVDTETVNLSPTDPAAAPVNFSIPGDLNSQLELYRKGLALKSSNPGEATKIFQDLESKAAPNIKVRAKLQVGEMLLSRQQYDLALQVFEDIINKYAHSGVVLDALKYAEYCTDKLGIGTKKEQYHSMLSDVFEAK